MDCFLHESFIMRYVYMAGSPVSSLSPGTPSNMRQQIAMSRLPIQQQQQQRSMSASTGTARFACRVVIDDVSDWNHQTKQVPIAVSVRGLRPRQRAAKEVPRDYAWITIILNRQTVGPAHKSYIWSRNWLLKREIKLSDCLFMHLLSNWN